MASAIRPESSFNSQGCPRCRYDTFSPQRGTGQAWGDPPLFFVCQSVHKSARRCSSSRSRARCSLIPTVSRGSRLYHRLRETLLVSRSGVLSVDATGLPCLFRGLGFPRYSEFNHMSPYEGAIAYRCRRRARHSRRRCSGCRSAATTDRHTSGCMTNPHPVG